MVETVEWCRNAVTLHTRVTALKIRAKRPVTWQEAENKVIASAPLIGAKSEICCTFMESTPMFAFAIFEVGLQQQI